MSNKEITVEEWHWLLNRINKIESILNLRTTIPRPQSLKYGDITDLKFANEMIDAQRKTIRELKDENNLLKQKLARINQSIDNKIDEFKNGDYGDLPCNTIHMFLDLKEAYQKED